ncbi:MAG: 50S ribosomal protein L11 methyltransferase [Methanobrevibacter sp.]|jgi:predicted RNA methylase|nr:50S ribosomal protein L11 methyltransferase [Candidatus Methanovirga aequatorialis]
MIFKVTKYHQDLLKDLERLRAFFEAINEAYLKNKTKYDDNFNIAYDLGCGSGILSYYTCKVAKRVISIDKDLSIIKKAECNLKECKNVEIINTDILKYEFKDKADLIICEALDTGMIDEEQALIVNHALKYLMPNGTIIPSGIINIAEPTSTNKHLDHICYDEENNLNQENRISYKVLGSFINFNEVDFYKKIDLKFKTKLNFKINVDGILNSIKITTFTKLTEDVICGPTPMLNPPLLIPIKKKHVKKDDEVEIYLEYELGGGIETINVY